jgi:hypothetical protein
MPTYAGRASFGGAYGRVRSPGGALRAAGTRLCDDDYATDELYGEIDGEDFVEAGMRDASGRVVPHWSLRFQRASGIFVVPRACALHPTSRSSETWVAGAVLRWGSL